MSASMPHSDTSELSSAMACKIPAAVVPYSLRLIPPKSCPGAALPLSLSMLIFISISELATAASPRPCSRGLFARFFASGCARRQASAHPFFPRFPARESSVPSSKVFMSTFDIAPAFLLSALTSIPQLSISVRQSRRYIARSCSSATCNARPATATRSLPIGGLTR